jgi:hypothetical protein
MNTPSPSFLSSSIISQMIRAIKILCSNIRVCTLSGCAPMLLRRTFRIYPLYPLFVTSSVPRFESSCRFLSLLLYSYLFFCLIRTSSQTTTLQLNPDQVAVSGRRGGRRARCAQKPGQKGERVPDRRNVVNSANETQCAPKEAVRSGTEAKSKDGKASK